MKNFIKNFLAFSLILFATINVTIFAADAATAPATSTTAHKTFPHTTIHAQRTGRPPLATREGANALVSRCAIKGILATKSIHSAMIGFPCVDLTKDIPPYAAPFVLSACICPQAFSFFSEPESTSLEKAYAQLLDLCHLRHLVIDGSCVPRFPTECRYSRTHIPSMNKVQFPQSLESITFSNGIGLRSIPIEISALRNLTYLGLVETFNLNWDGQRVSRTLFNGDGLDIDKAPDISAIMLPPSITTIDLSRSELRSIPGPVSQLPDLQELILTDNREISLVGMPSSVEILKVDGCNLKDISPIFALPNLQELYLWGNPDLDHDVVMAQLRQRYPHRNIKVFWDWYSKIAPEQTHPAH